MSLDTELQEAINKNLPSMVGAELVKRLEQADKDAAEVRRLAAGLATARNENTEINGKLAEALGQLEKQEALALREAAVAEAERGLEVRMLKHQLEVSDGNVKFAREVAMGLVRNTEFKRDVFTSQNNRALPVTQGGTVMHGYTPETTHINTSEEAK